MKLYDGGRAPNPRRVRIYLAEKCIEVATQPVDIGALAQRSPEFTALNPMQRTPVLVLDDGAVIAESIATAAISRNSQAVALRHQAYPGRAAGGDVAEGGWNSDLLDYGCGRIPPPCHSRHMRRDGVPQVPEWGEANKLKVQKFLPSAMTACQEPEFLAGEFRASPTLPPRGASIS